MGKKGWNLNGRIKQGQRGNQGIRDGILEGRANPKGIGEVIMEPNTVDASKIYTYMKEI